MKYSRSIVRLVKGDRKKGILDNREWVVDFKLDGKERSVERRFRGQNEEMAYDGVQSIIAPTKTWGSSKGGRPIPLGSLAILDTPRSPR